MAPEKVDSFVRIFEFEYESVPVVLYRCSKTGLRICLARVQSPTVHGYFTAQTEAFDDYGCPHTLEHLIFMGSERYPYKGVLDVLANRCFAQGTNAWTDVDHTCYTIDTAGSEGFLRILPVYLDHVLFPTLTDSSFLTEVHHITDEGKDAGVVYCEMEARENEAGDMMEYALKQELYPGTCSYKSETGGRLKELRDLKNKTVQDYHTAYYRPENLCVIVTGQVDYTELCSACAPVVEAILASEKIKALPTFQRPFASPVPYPIAPTSKTIDFPAEDEKSGSMVNFAWNGPGWMELETITALDILMTYLTQDAVAPLRKALVETLPAFCGRVSFSMAEQTTYMLKIALKSVDNEQLASRDVNAEISAVLQAVAAEGGAGIDLERMKSVIGQSRRKHFSNIESSPHDMFSGSLIGAFLYAPGFAPDAVAGAESGIALKERLDYASSLAPLLEWPASKWAALCDTWLIGPKSCPRVTLFGKPSKACGQLIQETDAARVAKQKEELGEDGCKAHGEKLQQAEESNDVDTPDEVIDQFQLPDASKISLIDVSSVKVRCGMVAQLAGGDAGAICDRFLPISKSSDFPKPTFQIDHAAGAQFATCCLLLPTSGLTVQQLELLPLWFNVAFELPLAASALGPAMTFEGVVQALVDLTVSKTMYVHCDVISVRLKVERTRYSEAPLWIARVLADVDFDVDRLKVAAKRILNDIPNVKRNGKALMGMAMQAMNYRDEAPDSAFNSFRAERVLSALLESDDSLKAASEQLACIRTSILKDASKFYARVGGDVMSIDDVFAPWQCSIFASSDSSSEASVPMLTRDLFASDALRPASGSTGGCLVSSSAEESNYWKVQCPCITDPRSPDLGALLVAMEYCTALEGPFWRKIRGRGLSYSYSMSNNLSSGTIGFGLFKATDPVAAFNVAKDIILKLCGESSNDKTEAEEEDEDAEDEAGMDPSALEGAQSGVLFSLFEGVDTIPGALAEAFQYTLDHKEVDQLQWLLKEVQAVTVETAQMALRKHVLPLFTGASGRIVSMICPEKTREQLQESLAKMDPPFHVAHLQVADLVKTLAPANGFATLRGKAREAASDLTQALGYSS